MVKKHYLPRAFEKRVRWLNNFAQGFGSIGPELGFTPEEIEAVKNDAAMLNWTAKVQVIISGTHKSFTAFKDILNEGVARELQLSVPVLPELPPPPDAVAPGIFSRIGKLVQRIKSNRDYTIAIGMRLGVIGAEQKIDFSKVSPKIVTKVTGGKLIVVWNKSVFNAIELSINRNDGKGFGKGRSYNHSPVKLEIILPLGQRSALWQIVGNYRIKDEIVGQPSPIVEVAVSQ